MTTKTRETVSTIKSIGDAARETFVDREEMIDAMEISMVSGLHGIILGPPGTGKSKLVSYFAKAMGVPFFRKLLNPDLPREDLVGPLDPAKLQKGIWDRKWLGLATCPVVFMDEIGKASAQVMNILLDAMEERKASCGDIDIDIPLHSLISASNETIASESPAMWNRFTIRVVVGRVTETRDFQALLKTAWEADDPPAAEIKVEDLQDLRTTCVEMASKAHSSPSVMRVMTRMFSDYSNVGSVDPTPRQWLNVLVAAAAQALLSGREMIAPSDLNVAGMILWDDIDEIADVKQFVSDAVEQEDQKYNAALETAGKMALALEDMDGNNLEGMGQLSYRSKALLRAVEEQADNTGEERWELLASELAEIVAEIEIKGVAGIVDPFRS
jgi:MoxR-like ATPase